jgi:chromosomal replication initiation ATPase DnaA
MNDQTFDTFITSESNKHALTVINELFASIKYGSSLNPLVICSKESNGKTHLLNAIKHRLESEFPEKTVKYINPVLIRKEITKYFIPNETTDRIIKAIPKLNLFEYDFLLFDDFQKFPLREKLLITLGQELQKGLRNGQQLIITTTYIPQTYWAIMETMGEVFKNSSIVTLYCLQHSKTINNN